MSDTVQAPQEKPEEKEADHHPYFRPKDAATLILVDRSGPTPKVLVGKRHDNVVFMPGKFVFPGGRVDKADNRVRVAAPIPKELEENLQKGSPKINAARARSLAIAAIREACEETGLCLGRKGEGAAPKLDGAWKPFLAAYNEFCNNLNGTVLLNQTWGVTRAYAQKSMGDRLKQFAAARKQYDPNNRLLNAYFQDLLAD